MRLALGSYMHQEIENALREVVPELIEGAVFLREVETQITDWCKGTCDGIIATPTEDIIVEIKTISSTMKKKIPLENHILQLHLYMMGNVCQRGLLIYISIEGLQHAEILDPIEIYRDRKIEAELRQKIQLIEAALQDDTIQISPTPHYVPYDRSHCTQTCEYRHRCPAAKRAREQLDEEVILTPK